MTRGTNFSLIEDDKQLQALYEAGISIEDLIEFNQNLTLIKERFFNEELVNYLFSKSKNTKKENTLQQNLDQLNDKGIIKQDDYNTLLEIKNIGNKAVHQGVNGEKGIHREKADELFIVLKKYINSEKGLSQSQINKKLDAKYFATYLGKNEIASIIDTKCQQIEACLKHDSITPSQFEQFNNKLQDLEQKLAASQTENLITEAHLQDFAETRLTSLHAETQRMTTQQINSALLEMNKTKNSVLNELSKLEQRIGKLEIGLHELVKKSNNHESRLNGLENKQKNIETVKETVQDLDISINHLTLETRNRDISNRNFTRKKLDQSVYSVNNHTKTVISKGFRKIAFLLIFVTAIGIGLAVYLQTSSSPSVIANSKEGEVISDITGKVIKVRSSDKGYIFIDIETDDGVINVPVFDTEKVKNAIDVQKGDTLSVSGQFGIYQGQKQIKPTRYNDLIITDRTTQTVHASKTDSSIFCGEIIDKYLHDNGHIFLTVKTSDETLEVPLFASIDPIDLFEIGDTLEFSGEESIYKGMKQIIPESMDDVKIVN